jgi:two-component system sensor histidine kinase RegB
MPDDLMASFDEAGTRLRLETLVRLRWLAVAGQVAAIGVVQGLLGFPLPLVPALMVVGTSVLLNLVLASRYPVSHRLGGRSAAALLAFDIIQLAGLLYLTGGLENPFALLFLAPVMISAAVLPPSRTFALGVLAMAMATLLAFVHRPLPWEPGEALAFPLTYRVGVWFAILLGLTFIGVYAWRVTEEARDLAAALAATELVLAREQHLSQLDGLAAAAAHELGTPLATIALVTREMQLIGPRDGPLADDIALLAEQVTRCRTILSKITSLGDERGGPLQSLTLAVLLEELAGPHRPFDVALRVEMEGESPVPSCLRNPGILYGLGNLVENAVDFARHAVVLRAAWDDEKVVIAVEDDGPGFPPDILQRIGEPYVTTRGTGRRAKSEEGSGMGLGLFIAKTLLERSGAALRLENGAAGLGGAVARVTWPRAAFERGTTMETAARVEREAAQSGGKVNQSGVSHVTAGGGPNDVGQVIPRDRPDGC